MSAAQVEPTPAAVPGGIDGTQRSWPPACIQNALPGCVWGGQWLCGPYGGHVARSAQEVSGGQKEHPAGERTFDVGRQADFAACMVKDAPRRGRHLRSACPDPAAGPPRGTRCGGTGIATDGIGDAEAAAGGRRGACCTARQGMRDRSEGTRPSDAFLTEREPDVTPDLRMAAVSNYMGTQSNIFKVVMR